MNTRESHIKDSIQIIEKLFHCHICMHGYTGNMKFITPYHLNPVCTMLKKKYPPFIQDCFHFESTTIRSFLLEGNDSIVKICPAGLLEVAVPVVVNGWTDGVLFAGPFLPDDSPGENRVVAKPYSGIREDFRLPKLKENQIGHLSGLCRLLADAIAHELEHAPTVAGEFPEHVRHYIQHHFHLNIGLDDLAAYLKLSPSRLSVKLKEELKSDFRTLVNLERMNAAEKLLRNSIFSNSEIASRCGFTEDKYFYRIFKKLKGMTPREYRKKNGAGRISS